MPKKRQEISQREIAEKLGISKNAVSLALSNKPGVSDELREKVLRIARDLNYKGVSKKGTNKGNSFLMLIPEYIRNDPNFYNFLYWTIENEAKQRGFNAIMACVDKGMEGELRLPNLYYELSAKGILILGILSTAYVRKVAALGLPLVSVDSVYEEHHIDAVGNANFESGYIVTSYLIDKGHRDIGFIGPLNVRNFFERWCGYGRAMRERGLRVPEAHCICEDSPMTGQFREPSEVGEHLSRLESLPTAFVCAGDHIAVALMSVLAQRNVRVPEEVSVVGIDDIELSRVVRPQLTTYAVDRSRIGFHAVEMLLQNIEKRSFGEKRLEIYGSLVERSSVRDLNQEPPAPLL